MSTLPLFVLHWGEVDRTLNVVGVKPTGRTIKPIKGADLGNQIETRSTVKRIRGGGSTRGVSGSGSTGRITGGGGGKICD